MLLYTEAINPHRKQKRLSENHVLPRVSGYTGEVPVPTRDLLKVGSMFLRGYKTVVTVVKRRLSLFRYHIFNALKSMNGYGTHMATKNGYDRKEGRVIPFCHRYYDVPFECSPFKLSKHTLS